LPRLAGAAAGIIPHPSVHRHAPGGDLRRDVRAEEVDDEGVREQRIAGVVHQRFGEVPILQIDGEDAVLHAAAAKRLDIGADIFAAQRLRRQSPARPDLRGELRMHVFEGNAEAGREQETAELVAAGAGRGADDERLVRAFGDGHVVIGPGEIDEIRPTVEGNL
jgi:hypothetical protein